jgi:hypothetical protein
MPLPFWPRVTSCSKTAGCPPVSLDYTVSLVQWVNRFLPAAAVHPRGMPTHSGNQDFPRSAVLLHWWPRRDHWSLASDCRSSNVLRYSCCNTHIVFAWFHLVSAGLRRAQPISSSPQLHDSNTLAKASHKPILLVGGSPEEVLQFYSITQSHSEATLCLQLQGHRFAPWGCTHTHTLEQGFSLHYKLLQRPEDRGFCKMLRLLGHLPCSQVQAEPASTTCIFSCQESILTLLTLLLIYSIN